MVLVHPSGRFWKILIYLYHGFYLAVSQAISYVYDTVIFPVLNYVSCVWDPQHKIRKQHLEWLQSYTAKIVTKCWQETPSTLKQLLGWPLLETRRIYSKLYVCSQIFEES